MHLWKFYGMPRENIKNAGENAPRDTVENKYIHSASQCFHGKIYYGAQQCFHGDTNNAFCGVKKTHSNHSITLRG